MIFGQITLLLRCHRRCIVLMTLICASRAFAQETAPSHFNVNNDNASIAGLPDLVRIRSLLERDDLRLRLPDATAEIPIWVGHQTNEPFPVREFLKNRRPQQPNAASTYLRGLAPLHPSMGFIFPEPSHLVLDQQFQRLSDSIKEVANLEQLKSDTTPIERVEQLLKLCQPALATIDQAQTTDECLFETGLMLDSKLFHVEAARQVARLAVLEMHIATRTEILDFARIEHSINRTLRLSRDLRPRSPIIGQMVTVALEYWICNGLSEFVLPNQKLTPKNCDRFLDLLSEHQTQTIDAYLEGLRVEYIVMGNILAGLQSGDIQPDYIDIKKLPNSAINYKLEWKTANRAFHQLIQAWDKNPAHKLLNDFPIEQEMDAVRRRAEVDARNALLQKRLLAEPVVCSLILPMYEKSRLTFIKHRARLVGLKSLIVVRRYELTHGRPPQSLIAAFQDVGERNVPIDPYSGKPFRYAVIDGEPIVYSVGLDQHDDGGLIDWRADDRRGDYLFQIKRRL